MIIATALTCLALNIYHEARGEPIEGQYAVALVTINRAKGDESKVCAETFKPKQFSWTGKVKETSSGWNIPKPLYPRLNNKAEEQAWWQAVRVTRNVLSGRVRDFTRGSLHYHATVVTPSWSKRLEYAFTIGSHRFYLPQKVSQS